MSDVPHVQVDELAREQGGVLTRDQLAAIGVSADHVRWAIRARRWRIVGRVVVVHRGPLTAEGQWWAAVLHVGPRACLAVWSALQADGLAGFERDVVHVVVPAGHHPRRVLAWIKVHVSRRLHADDIIRGGGPPRLSVARAAIDAAAWSTTVRAGCAIVAACVQQRLTTTELLNAELGRAGRIRHRRIIAAVIADIEGGSQALSEIDLVALCRRFGLPFPERQVIRRDSSGRRRYLDAWWRRLDGRVVHLEVDGAVHLSPLNWWGDMDRQTDLAIEEDALVVRVAAVALRIDQLALASRLARALGVTLRVAA